MLQFSKLKFPRVWNDIFVTAKNKPSTDLEEAVPQAVCLHPCVINALGFIGEVGGDFFELSGILILRYDNNGNSLFIYGNRVIAIPQHQTLSFRLQGCLVER